MKDRVLTVRIDQALSAAMERLQQMHGTKPSDQVRKALEEYLTARGAIKAERRPGPTGRRS